MKYIFKYMKLIRKLVVVSQSRYNISLRDCFISDISWDGIYGYIPVVSFESV